MNFPPPRGLVDAADAEMTQHLHQPVTEPGDVVFFAEATMHGAAPWTASHERRIALFRFAPAERSYGRCGSRSGWPEAYLDGCTPAQRAVLEPAYNTRLDRPVISIGTSDSGGAGVTDDGSLAGVRVEIRSRSAEKKAFDREVFGTEFF